MTRVILLIAAASGFCSVGLGAFAAHGLKSRLSPDMLAVFQTGVQYQFLHTLALLALAWMAERAPCAAMLGAAWAFGIGILLFSGSLYALALSGVRPLGAITPFGGLSFLAGWTMMGYGVWRSWPTV